ncbi:glutathione S-transferase family protein [Myxococcus sp. 1LA]
MQRCQKPARRFARRVWRARPGSGSSLEGSAPGGGDGHVERREAHASYACPWASRLAIIRKLEGAIGLTVVDPRMGDDGWTFQGYPGSDPEPFYGFQFLRELYVKARADYTGRVTVPVLWDRQRETVVNNESRELLRMLDTEFDAYGDASVQLAPPHLRAQVDATLDAIYPSINNGVYRAGFATSQQAHEDACRELFAALDTWEQVLGTRRYLCGATLTEADVCLYTTLVRFDLVYHAHFKCNLRRIQDYPNLWGYLKDLYQTPGFTETTQLDHIQLHYYWSQTTVNPTRVVPLGPTVPLGEPHDRARRLG